MVISLFEGCYDTAHVQLTISVESAVNNNLKTRSRSFSWKEDCPAAPTRQAVDRGSVTKCLQNCLQSILRGRNTSPCGGQRG